ncbi:hypothetical protein ACH4ZX_39695 [Streptomyces sp. NPDC020490]|uniref:hypothetical protein n=1 Tax=Streptomyces sp. NPDC020490 TaxID=3365078 RepID=UPI00378FE1B9
MLTALRLAFDAPRGPGGTRGSVLGGVGLAVTRSCQDLPAARAQLLRLLSPGVQTDDYRRFGGQSSLAEAWDDETVHHAVHGFYRDTRRTMDAAWTRPRFPGYIGFQQQASAAVRDGLSHRTPPARVLAQLDTLLRTARAGTRTGGMS